MRAVESSHRHAEGRESPWYVGPRNRANVMILAVRAIHMTRRSCRGRESLSAVRPGPTVCGAWRVRSLTPMAYRLPLQQGEDCLRAGIGLRQGEGAGL